MFQIAFHKSASMDWLHFFQSVFVYHLESPFANCTGANLSALGASELPKYEESAKGIQQQTSRSLQTGCVRMQKKIDILMRTETHVCIPMRDGGI